MGRYLSQPAPAASWLLLLPTAAPAGLQLMPSWARAAVLGLPKRRWLHSPPLPAHWPQQWSGPTPPLADVWCTWCCPICRPLSWAAGWISAGAAPAGDYAPCWSTLICAIFLVVAADLSAPAGRTPPGAHLSWIGRRGQAPVRWTSGRVVAGLPTLSEHPSVRVLFLPLRP